MNPDTPGAIFIDFDNVYIALMNIYGNELSAALEKAIKIAGGVISFVQINLGITPIIRQAFGDWSSYPEAMNELYIMGIKPVHIKAIARKNSADIELSLSLQEVILTRSDVNVVIVVAGDRDYMPITLRVREKAKQILFFSFGDCMSGDLRKLISEENCYFIEPDAAAVIEREAATSGEDTGIAATRPEPQPIASKEPILSNHQMKALRAAIDAEQVLMPKYGSVKVSRFLVVELAAALPELDHLQRKEVFNSLVVLGILTTEYEESRGWDYDAGSYTVFRVNHEHSIVKRLENGHRSE